jgi:ATP-dependent protease HslVU (ClpYQ) peptidase subunit
MALRKHSSLDAETIAREALEIASRIDIYTNGDIVVEVV